MPSRALEAGNVAPVLSMYVELATADKFEFADTKYKDQRKC